MDTPFVGRQAEMGTLLGTCERGSRDGAPALVLAVGEPGSGKTRLLAEAARLLHPARTARASGFEPMQSIPLAAAGELLRQLGRVPGQEVDLFGLVFGSQDAGGRDPLRIFEAAHRALDTMGPFLLAIDDLQWVDEQSLALVHYLLRAAEPAHQRLTVLVGSRPSAASTALLASMQPSLPPERCLQIAMGPLPEEDGVALARAIDAGLSLDGAADLWRRAGGSPFWVEALARSGPGVGLGVANVIAERLRNLSGEAGEILGLLTVAARPVGLKELARALNQQAGRVRYASRELQARGVVVEVAGELQLAHDLIRESAERELPQASWRRFHALLAAAIEPEAGDDAQLLCEALGHRVAAGLPADAALATRVASSARRRLLGAKNLRLLASISDSMDAGIPEQIVLDSELARIAAQTGESELALDRWARVSRCTGTDQERQAAELGAAHAAYALGRKDEAHRHLDLARQSAESTLEASILLDSLEADVRLWLDHDTAGGRLAAERAIASADKLAGAAGGYERLPASERKAYAVALLAACDAALQDDRADDVLRLSQLIVALAQHLDGEGRVGALMRAAFALGPFGRIREAAAHYRTAYDISKRLVLPFATVEAGHGLAIALKNLGRLGEGRAVAEEAAKLETRLGNPPRRWGSARDVLHSIELVVGDPGRGVETLRQDAEAEDDPHYRLGTHELIALWLSRYQGARASREVAAELAAAHGDSDLAGCARCAAELELVSIEALARVGRVEEASILLAAATVSSRPSYKRQEIWALRARASVALAGEDPSSAVDLLTILASEQERIEMKYDLFWTRLDLGRALAPVSRSDAVEALSAAARLAEDMGAVSHQRLAARALRELGVRAWRRGRTSVGVGVESLSAREREIALMVAEGRSNREVAEALVVSPKTVERHITNTLAKLSVRNRTELAAAINKGNPGTGFPR